MTASPLGKYGEVAAALTALALVFAAIGVHVGQALTAIPLTADTTWLDASAGAAVGIILGQRATTNGAAKIANAAHERIDTLERASGIDTHTDKPVV